MYGHLVRRGIIMVRQISLPFQVSGSLLIFGAAFQELRVALRPALIRTAS